jgi:hypothetical protein
MDETEAVGRIVLFIWISEKAVLAKMKINARLMMEAVIFFII